MDREHKLLHIIPSRKLRGAEIFAIQLASCMENGGAFANTICSLYGRGEKVLTTHLPLVELNGHRPFPKTWSRLDLWRAYQLYSTVRSEAPHIILAHGADTLKYSVLAGAIYRRAPIIYRNIGLASYWASSRAKVLVNKLLLRRIAAVISVSQHGRADFIRHYGFPQERVVYIPNAVDVTEFDEAVLQAARPALRRAWGLQEGAVALINVGSLSPEKGQAELLRLTADLCASGLPIVLLLVGDGSLKQELGSLSCRLGIAERVRFLGLRTDIPKLLGAADLFVLTSKTEGMPGVLIEAGLAGLASVAYGVGGVAEVVAHEATGVVVPPGDYNKLVAAAAQLSADHQARADMGQRAQQSCLERFDIANVASAYEQLFAQVLSGTGS